MRICRLFLFLCVIALAIVGCSREMPPEAAPTPTTPAMPLPGTSTPKQQPAAKPQEPVDPEKPFLVFVRNCYLVDPQINPIGAPKSREKGIRMVVTGSVQNNSDRIIYRAGIFSKLVVYFGKNARFEKHSGGLGFDPPVTSTNPWRPGTLRERPSCSKRRGGRFRRRAGRTPNSRRGAWGT